MQKQSSIISGIVLILVGIFFLLLQLFPAFAQLINIAFLWPLIVLGLGVVFLFTAVAGNPPLSIPGAIISGVGAILFYQNTTGNWDFWQLWLLVPAFVGVGILLSSVLEGRGLARGLAAGGVPLAVGVILFLVFTIAFNFAQFWPVLLIILGLGLLARNYWRGKRLR